MCLKTSVRIGRNIDFTTQEKRKDFFCLLVRFEIGVILMGCICTRLTNYYHWTNRHGG